MVRCECGVTIARLLFSDRARTHFGGGVVDPPLFFLLFSAGFFAFLLLLVFLLGLEAFLLSLVLLATPPLGCDTDSAS